MSGIEKRFLGASEKKDEHNYDRVHRTGMDAPLGGQTLQPGGEIADLDDPESILIRKEAGEKIPDRRLNVGLTAAQNRARIKELQEREAREQGLEEAA